MADENLDSDYHGSPYLSLSLRERVKRALDPEEIKRAIPKLRRRRRLVLAELPDGSRAILARDGWYAFDEERLRADYDRPVEVPKDLRL